VFSLYSYGHMSESVERPYKSSHPWLTFAQIDLRRAGPDFWLLLGEARSKVEHLSLALLKPNVAEEMLRVYLAKGVHATTAIEGNTLSEAEVADILAGHANPPPSEEYLYREVENVISAYNRIKDGLLAGGSPELTVDSVKRFNREVLDGLEMDDVRPGEIRTKSVVVGPYRGAPWQDCEYLVGRLCEWLNGSDFVPKSEEWTIPYGLIKAVAAHLYMAWIHPFDDGNGRTARLIELQVLLAAAVPMPAAHLLSNHYNVTRAEYYRQLEHASKSGGDVVPFLNYAIQGFVDGIRQQVERVWGQQYEDRWEQFVYESFGRVSTQAAERRRRLALELSKRDEPVLRRDVPRMTPELSEAYRNTQRMLSRDLNALEAVGLIERTRRGWRASKEQLLAFRPLRRQS